MSIVSDLSFRSKSSGMDTAYHPVDPAPVKSELQTSTKQIEGSSITSKRKSKRGSGSVIHILTHVVGLLWIVPIVTLLVLNFKNHVIGASIWCPRGKCNAQAYGDNAIATANKLDLEDHNILGALQFAAKGLEVWFIAVATSLVYDVALYLAKSNGGLPIGYLFTHLEFSDLRNLMNPLLWTSPISRGNLMPSKPSGTLKLYLFAILAAFLTILTNLMGPSTAVLILPTLQWVDTGHKPAQVFGSLASSDSPRGNTVFPGCNDTQLRTRNYSCTSEIYGPSMDDWLSQSLSSTAQGEQDYGEVTLGTSQEGSVEFTMNVSTNGDLSWIPNRQVLRSLSYDLQDLSSYVFGDLQTNGTRPQKQPSYNNSLETILQREGPSIGVAAGCFTGAVTVLNLAKEKQVRCLDGWTPLDDISGYGNSNYTKCFRYGTGWAGSNQVAGFYLGDADRKANETYVRVYSSDKATAFNSTTDFGSQIQRCMKEGAKDCDWDQIFETPIDPNLANGTTNPLVIEYEIPNYGSSRVWCDAIAYSAFPTYTLDTAASANPLWLVSLDKLPAETDKNFNKTPIAVSPDWVLAAWSVANNGTVDRSREIGKELARVAPSAFEPFNETFLDPDQWEFVFIHFYSLAQSLSLINYEYSDDKASLSAAVKAKDKSQPVFATWATLRVWAYGLSGRTPKLGVAVSILGCGCVLLRLILAVSLRIKHEHGVVELLVAALEHQPTQEFDDLHDEAKMAKVRYIMQGGHGRPKFVSERVHRGRVSGSLQAP